jgi:hypothetical protein
MASGRQQNPGGRAIVAGDKPKQNETSVDLENIDLDARVPR